MGDDHDFFAGEQIAVADDERIRQILDQVCALTGMGFAAVARVTDKRWIACQLVDRIEFGLNPGDELDLKTTICSEIRGHGDTVVIDHVAADPRWRTHHTPIMYGFESYAAFPIRLANGDFFGTLCAIDPHERTLSAPAVVAALAKFAEEIAAILSARLGRANSASETAPTQT